ncbi:FadR/GntR family transcriptional regulator [Micromonospora sp. 4G55]|uniref:FadR/GntR family transcriptional regulator n=1 Tax=Micromonospora sp. 4G55 TaxID=2806102 RepID=UPI001A44FA89|nr:GntR family transcriptional regulator [Micromonospora sp. 4G55]MBM0255793.1 FadR family transcriptional regulator [Micromonospora sp. 4G55]
MDQSSPGVAPVPHAPAEAGLHARVLDHLGTDICGGLVAAGSVLNIDDLVERYGVSRSVIREVLRVLASMGFVETRRRSGS